MLQGKFRFSIFFFLNISMKQKKSFHEEIQKRFFKAKLLFKYLFLLFQFNKKLEKKFIKNIFLIKKNCMRNGSLTKLVFKIEPVENFNFISRNFKFISFRKFSNIKRG